MPKNCAIYLRISQDASRDGLAVERQRQDCEALAAERGWDVVNVYSDTVSASKRNVRRPAYDRMLAAYKAGKYSALICWDLDRLTRQPAQLEVWIELAEEHGLVIVTANGEADLEKDGGRMYARIKASVARAEIERKGARHLRANVQRSEAGRPVPGRRRYGYETNGLTPVEAEAVVVRRLFAHVAEGGSLRSAVKWLEAEGVSPAPGKEWSARRITDILKNPHYTGRVRHLGVVIESDVVTPIVDAELAANVVAILSDPSRKTSPGPKPRHLLSGLMNCGECGHVMTYMRSYLCKPSPGHVSIQKSIIEPRVRDEIAKAFISGGPSLFPTGPNGSDISALIAAHEKNTANAAATIEDRDEGLVTPKAARALLVKLRDARVAIEEELELARTAKGGASALLEIAQGLIVKPSFEMHEYAEMKETVLARFDELDLDKQREIVRALLYIEVHSGRDISRVWVEHKLAVHLNPDFDTDARYYDDADADLDARYNGTDEPADGTEPPRHPRWTPEGAPLDLDPASAAFMEAESIVREAHATL
jgi:DNA invertase Pin-like site-specific DNA recombinase